MATRSPLLRHRAPALALALAATLLPAAALAAPDGGSEAAASTDGQGPSLALLPIRFADPLPEADERELESVISSAFAHPELTLIEGAKVEQARESACAKGSNDEGCLRAIGDELGTTHVIELVVRHQSRDFELEFRVLRMSSDRPANIVEVECEVCGVTEVRDSLAAQAALLRDRLLVDTEPGRVVVEGAPEGAKLSIDGRRVGELPFEGELNSGEHELRVSARGYYDQFIPVTVSPGTVERIEIELEPEPNAGAGSRDWQKPVGWTLLGVGVAGLVAGASLYAIDGQPYAGRCSDPANIDVNGNCQWIYQTADAGVTVLSLGVAAASVGATMLLLRLPSKSKPKPDASEESQASVRARQRAQSLRLGFGLTRLELSGRF